MFLSDRAKAGLTTFVRQVVGLFIIGPNVDRLALYWAKVISQNADGTLELKPEDDRLPPYSNVPIVYGVPGETATVPAGVRAVLTFAGADPRSPIVVGWSSASVTLLQLGGTSGLQGVGLGGNIRTELDALWSAIYGGHTHILTLAAASGSGGTGTAAPAVGSPSTQTVASSVVKVKP